MGLEPTTLSPAVSCEADEPPLQNGSLDGRAGTSNSEAISTIVLPSGRCAYVSQTINLYWDIGSGTFVLAAAERADRDVDLAFLRILFTDSEILHRRFMPNTSNIDIPLTIDEVTDLYWESGFDPNEYEDEYDAFDEEDAEEEGEEDGDPSMAAADEDGVPAWAADLYVFPVIRAEEERNKREELHRQYHRQRHSALAIHYAVTRRREGYAPYVPDDNRDEYKRRELIQQRNSLRAWVEAKMA
jgi:hypothetical protein